MNDKDLYEEEDINDAMNEDDEIDDNEEDVIIDDNEEEEEVEDRVDHNDNDNNDNDKEQNNTNTNDVIKPTAPPNPSNEANSNDVLNFLLSNPITVPQEASAKAKFPDEDNISEIKPFPQHSKIPNPNTNFPANLGSSHETNEADFNQALTKILSNMSKNASSAQDEVYDLLINDKELIENELKKYSFTKRTDIASKIKTYLDIRSQKMKKLEQQANDEFNKNYTFTPLVNTVSSSTSTNISQIAQKKRNLNEFLQDQENYQKKVKDKMSAMKSTQDKKAVEELKLKPQICTTSKKIAKEKNKSNEEVYKRLYKQQHVKDKQVSQSNSNQTIIKKNVVNKEKFDNLYNDAKIREQRIKEKENIENKKLQQSQIYKPNTNSNKYLFQKFKSQFKEQIEQILLSSNNIDKFTFDQLKTLFTNLNFITNTANHNVTRTQTQLDKEKQILHEIYSILKDDNTGLVKIDHIFIFCLSILNLLEYYIKSNYQDNANDTNTSDNTNATHSTNETNCNGSGNTCKTIEDEESQLSTSQRTLKSVKSSNRISSKGNTNSTNGNDALIHKINNDLLSRIKTPKKYGGFDCNGNYIISISQSKQLFKDYAQLNQNYNSGSRKDMNFQLNTINQNNYRHSRLPTHNNSNNNNTNSNTTHYQQSLTSAGNKKTSHSKSKSNAHNAIKAMNRIEQLYQESVKKKIQHEKEIEKYNQNKLNEELKLCTFKPKINTNSHYKSNVVKADNAMPTQEQRIEMLYKKGTEALLNKKDKTRNEIEIEKYHSECTFKPDIHEVNYEIFDKNKSIYQDDDLMKFHQRLKNGRDEKEYRESAFERGEFLLRRPRNKSEGKSFIRKNDSSNIGGSFANNNTNTNVSQKNTGEGNVIMKRPREGERPLLEIDVNLKHGVKKKILVFEGDTAEELAEIFSEENSKCYFMYII